ncbi:DEAD/DEAH box helicase [Aspergillus unguis]
MDPDELQTWFDGLASRTLDLVGDYAGDELFIIEGDSLLLQCFSDATVDFSHGLQLLHVTYLVERFLAQLHQRKCVFHVVFFSDHSQVCIPPGTDERLWPKFLLAREAIYQHLLQNLPVAVPLIQVRRFETYRCGGFYQYLQSVGAYFLMCHDGTSPVLGGNLERMIKSAGGSEDLLSDGDSESSSSEEPSDPSRCLCKLSSKLRLRSMIHWFVLHGYNVSILNSLECRDSKVLSMILEGSVSAAQKLYANQLSTLQYTNRTAQSPDIDSQLTNMESLTLDSGDSVAPALPISIDYCWKMKQQILDKILVLADKDQFYVSQREWATIVTLGVMSRSSFDFVGLIQTSAMLLHASVMGECKLNERPIYPNKAQDGESFLSKYASVMENVLTSSSWREIIAHTPGSCDLGDAVDGRLFLDILRVIKQTKSVDSFSSSTQRRFLALQDIFTHLFGVNLDPVLAVDQGSDSQRGKSNGRHKKIALKHSSNEEILAVLPFMNPIFDAHLKPISVTIADYADEAVNSNMSRIFQELSYWHNHKRALNGQLNVRLTDWQKQRILRRNQFFMADVRRYAASLTNSVGGSLQPETVFVKAGDPEQSKKPKYSKNINHAHPEACRIEHNSSSGHKKNGQNTKPKVRDQIAARQLAKANAAVDKHFTSWKLKLADLEREYDYSKRYVRVKQYLAELPADKRITLKAEILTYMTSTLLLIWKERCTMDQGSSMPIIALIWHTIQQIARTKDGITDEIAKCMHSTLTTLNLPALELAVHGKRSLSFKFAILGLSQHKADASLSPTEFQLIHAGPYMDRSMGSASDPRVQDFEPDKWQREVLDEIDARRSLFVVAPTSAGKTFISFYAMKQILEDDSDGILVYVAPTKALVNQIAAEVQARFSKSFDNSPGKSVWAIHTRDYRINNPAGCQVLVTVPHILQIMLLAPSNARSWSPRIRRIIFDEVHCIGQAEDGVIWEQLLLLAPCPIIALSATVGNPDEFKQWLGMAQKANGLELKMIQHKSRYSDLRKYIYSPPREFAFNGLSAPSQLSALGLDESPNMQFLHPIASLVDRFGGFPDDLTLEPRDCLMLWKAMKKHETQSFPVPTHLNPFKALPRIIKKADVIDWEAQLRTLMRDWMSRENSPFEDVVKELSQAADETPPEVQISCESKESLKPTFVKRDNLFDTTLPLLCSLNDQGALPALFFNYDREKCEQICHHIMEQLKASEDYWKASSPLWKKKLAKFEDRQKAQERMASVKEPKKKKGRKNDDDDDNRVTQADLARENSSEGHPFNPDDPVSGFHFADETKLTPSEFDEYADSLKQRQVSEQLIRALRRGIGIHHAGMNRRYRQVCEMLFRKGYLRVVIATGTLALGINMPCKTVVFSGDSVFLTALNFRQAAGRAGRRGFDFLGNVVFQCLPRQKAFRLLRSRLPDLNGHFPITTSLVLRLMALLHESKQAPYSVKAINSILSCPRIYLGGPESKHTVLHHLRFSIEYLRRNWLLAKDGAPLNYAGMVSHLYYTENSSFAFHALFSEGFFHRLSRDINKRPKETLLTLMLVMSHLFGRQHLRPNVLESWASRKKSTSVVILPQMPRSAMKILCSHNRKTLDIYSAYVTTFIDQHVRDHDNVLPLTGVKCGGSESAQDVATSLGFMQPALVTSAFIALSGHRDEWKSISELCSMVRNGVWLEQSVIPHMPLAPEKTAAPLNAYLYDFFKHGNVHALATENMIRRGDLWFLLNDFSLVLATIVTSLENFLKLSPGTDTDMLDAMGSGDVLEDEWDDKVFEADRSSMVPQMSEALGRQPAGASASRLLKAKKTKVVDSWEDNLSDSDDAHELSDNNKDNRASESRVASTSDYSMDHQDAGGVIEGKGLLQVLHAFRLLQTEFNEKFKAIWA